MYNKIINIKDDEMELFQNINDNYIEFLSNSKTEREAVKNSIELLKKAGFKDLDKVSNLKKGDKVYAVNRGKNVAAFIIGDNIKDGINILGAHIDSPRLDIKQNPLYENDQFAYLDTHYYGGIIKYQWATIPLSIHGVVVKKNGKVLNISIGEDEKDPVFTITDLLPHLGKDKLNKSGNEVITGEDLDLLVGSGDKDIKKEILKIINAKYNISEEDFLSSELEIVPQGKARSLGFDSSMILGYGHDDRVCAYTSLRAIIDSNDLTKTSCAILVDKEEIGSVGATGAHSLWFQNVIGEIIYKTLNEYNDLLLRNILSNSYMLSSDVSAGFDPIYSNVFDKKNAAKLGYGITFNKYTGARGKSGCNDASAEYMAKIRNIMDSNDINFQTAELGKVDQGGGGTIAYILANMNINVIDAGVPVLSMHAPFEVVSKKDVFEAYKAYMAFIKFA